MNKPKWLELIWLLCWMSPPIILAMIVRRVFQFDVLAYVAISALLIIGWFASIICWSRSKPTETQNENNPRNVG
jgi:hypothetical protein